MRRLMALVLVLQASAFGAEIRRIHLPTTALVADPVHGRIYATTPGTAGLVGNRVVTIFPDSVSFVSSPLGAFVGSEPATLAIDDQATVLYVGLRGSPHVSRVQLSTFTRDLVFSPGTADFFGTLYAQDLAVMPGAPGTVAISLSVPGFSPQHQGVAVFDDGVRRPVVTASHTGSNIIVFGTDPSRLYGLNNETTEFGFRRMTIDETGVTVTDVSENFVTGFGSDIEFDGQYVVTTGGSAILPEGGFGPTLAGSYTVDGDFGIERVFGPVESDPAHDRVYYVYKPFSDDHPSLLTYARSTFTLLEERALPQVAGTVHSLVRWGTDGLAFGTTEGSVFLVGTFPPCTFDRDCDDGDECTTDTCDGGSCAHAPVSCSEVECGGSTCDPQRGCITSNENVGQPCTDDGNPCTDDRCGFDGCEHTTAYGLPCDDDGDPCTGDFCTENGCEHSLSQGSSCTDDGDACTQDVCDSLGGCLHDAFESDGLAYYQCSFENVTTALLPEPLCADKCEERLRQRYQDLEDALSIAFRSVFQGSDDCRANMRRAFKRATGLAQVAKRLNKRKLLLPPERGAALVSASKETAKRMRSAAGRFCPKASPSAE